MANEITPIQEVQGTLAKMGDQFKAALPRHIHPDKFIRAAQTAIQNNPDLLTLSRPTLYNSLMKCAQDGLLADGREAVITKKGGDAVYMPMIGGILKLIRNSGELSSIDAEVVHEKDEYDSWTDEKGPHFRFKKYRGDRGAVIATFAYAVMKDGATYFEEVGNEEMAAIQKSAGTQFVWNGPFREEMMKKSALRRMSKRMSKSTDIEQVFAHDDENFTFEKPAEPSAPSTTSSKLADAVRPNVTEAVITDPAPVKQPEVKAEARVENTKTPASAVAGSQAVTQSAEAKPADNKPTSAQPGTDKPVHQPVNPVREPVNTPTGKVLKSVLFEKVTSKEGEKNGKKWTKFGGLVNGEWYGTFDKKYGDLMASSVANRVLMTFSYLDRVVGDKTYHEIVELGIADIKDCQDAGELPADDEVPI